MKQRRHTREQVVRKLREADRMLAEGKTIPQGGQGPGGLGGTRSIAGARSTAG